MAKSDENSLHQNLAITQSKKYILFLNGEYRVSFTRVSLVRLSSNCYSRSFYNAEGLFDQSVLVMQQLPSSFKLFK